MFLGSILWGIQKIGWQAFIGDADFRAYPQPEATVLWAMGLMAALLVLLGLPALYAHQAEQAGRLGAVAFVVAFLGMALAVSNAYFGTFLQSGLVNLIIDAEEAGVTVQEPVAAGVAFGISILLYALGWILFGVASIRARVLPRWGAGLVLAGLVLAFLFILTSIPWLGLPVIEIGIAWLGFAVWREAGKGELVAVRAPAT